MHAGRYNHYSVLVAVRAVVVFSCVYMILYVCTFAWRVRAVTYGGWWSLCIAWLTCVGRIHLPMAFGRVARYGPVGDCVAAGLWISMSL